MSKTVRIQRKRTKGWKMPPNTVYVGRPTEWGNPWGYRGKYSIKDPVEAVDKFRGWVKNLNLAPLRGKNLACWCPLDQPCHADVLLEIANEPTKELTDGDTTETTGRNDPAA